MKYSYYHASSLIAHNVLISSSFAGYCESFHNGLSQEERVVQMRHAKASIARYMQSIDKSLPVIGRGMEPPIDEAHFQLIADMAQQL